MYDFQLAQWRARLDQGEELAPGEVLEVLDELDKARAAALVPSEFVVRVHRQAGLTGWTAEHPLLLGSRHCQHPADALVLAGRDLREALARHQWPESESTTSRRSSFWHDQVPRTEADSLAAVDDSPTAQALAWALAELDERTTELHETKYGNELRQWVSSGDREARRIMREQAVARLAAANVTSAPSGYSDDGFDRADAVGLALPTLAIAFRSHGDRRSITEVYDPQRSWYALSHRTMPRPMSEYVAAVVTPLTINPDSELALRRLAPRVPFGNQLQDHLAFAALMAVEFPDIDVSRMEGPHSRSWVRFPMDSISRFTAGTPDADLDLNSLVRDDDFWPHRELVWITDEAEHRDM